MMDVISNMMPIRWRGLVQIMVVALAMLGLAASAAARDVVILDDGTRLEGRIVRSGENLEVIAADGTRTVVPANRVRSIEVSRGEATPGQADVRLQSLRRTVERMEDLSAVIARYEQFIAQNRDTPAAEEAREDLAEWRRRKELGLVRHAGEWLTPQERDAMLRETFEWVAQLRLQIKGGDETGARSLLAERLTQRPHDVSALYMMGVIELNRGELARARSFFERVYDRLPDHPPTLLNLAAINLRQNRHARAVAYLTEAMSALPGNREILDNVAEAIELLPERIARGRQAEEMRQTFRQQDTALRERMAQRDLFRWGSKWVPRAEYERLKEISRQVDERVAELEEEFRGREDAVRAIDLRIEENEQYMAQLRAQSVTVLEDGRILRRPLPPVYYDVERQNQQLAREREEQLLRLRRIPQEIALERQKIPTPPFDGRLQTIGEDGVPVLLPQDRPEEGPPAEAPPAAPQGDADDPSVGDPDAPASDPGDPAPVDPPGQPTDPGADPPAPPDDPPAPPAPDDPPAGSDPGAR